MAPSRTMALLLAVGCVGASQALEAQAGLTLIRKVLNTLQMMQKKVGRVEWEHLSVVYAGLSTGLGEQQTGCLRLHQDKAAKAQRQTPGRA